jgi:pimeloyl-ACP methyl ester carboxylesterase
VLLLSSTGLDTGASFGWNYQPALSAAGITWCSSNAPGANNGDIQARAEYVAYALREIRARTGRPVDVVGHGQGALVARLVLRFWPDLRTAVSDVIELAPPNQGTEAFRATCARACPPAYWQQLPGSMLVSAVNSRQATFAGVDYTVITSSIDDVITPQPAASALRPGAGRVREVAVQDVCPNYVADHLGLGGYDAVAWALAADALNNPGPADPGRLDRSVCDAGFMPAIDSQRFLDNSARAAPVLETVPPDGVPTVPAEPDPRCWVLADGCLTGGSR